MVESNIKGKPVYSHKEWKDNQCKYIIWKNTCFTTVSKKQAQELLETGKTVGNYKSKEGKPYKREIIYDKANNKFINGDYVK